MAALDTLFELAVRLGEMTQRGLAERGLSTSQAEALVVLDREGPMVQRQMGELMRCTPRYVTTVIDALEKDGLARRNPHPTDRRATVVSLTRRGISAASRMGAERHQAAQWLLGDVSPGDLDAFVAVAAQVLERIEAAEAAAPPEEEP